MLTRSPAWSAARSRRCASPAEIRTVWVSTRDSRPWHKVPAKSRASASRNMRVEGSPERGQCLARRRRLLELHVSILIERRFEYDPR
jgi:hypothetical protein